MIDPAAQIPASHPALDAAIAQLASGETAWGSTLLRDRATLLRRLRATVAEHAERWVETACRIKGIAPEDALSGEEWLAGPYVVLGNLTRFADSLDRLADGESPLAGTDLETRGNRVVVPVLPSDPLEGTLLNGFRGEVWLRPGVTAAQAIERAGLAARAPKRTAGIGLVLGAGNVTSIAPLDALYELIAHNRVVLLKLNPTMADMEDVYRDALAPLLDAGVLRIVQGGAETGAYLTHHPDIAHIHITGSAATHDAIVFGPGEEGAQRRAAGTPLLETPISSELGGVSPVILVPGEWSQADLEYQAAHVATMRLQNGGYNCIAGQLVLVSSDWPQKDDFLDAVRRALAEAPARPAWYPGSDSRVASALESYPESERLGPDGCRVLVQLGADDGATLQTTEYFSPVLGVSELPGIGQHFLDAAVDLANDDLVGTLGANVLIDPRTRKELGPGFDQAITRLRYGTIAVNTWTAFGFTTPAATWGAFPGHTLADVQSGRGVVHNALLLDDVERTVVEGPFRPFPRSVAGGESSLFPTPPWFITARSAATTGRRITEFAADPSWLRLLPVLAAAFRA